MRQCAACVPCRACHLRNHEAPGYRRWKGTTAELDARPGGLYRVLMPSGDRVRGEYVTVEPPHRVVFTWGFEGSTDLPPGSSTVEITLASDGDGTIVRRRHD